MRKKKVHVFVAHDRAANLTPADTNAATFPPRFHPTAKLPTPEMQNVQLNPFLTKEDLPNPPDLDDCLH